MATNVNDFIDHLDGGTLKEKLASILSKVAGNVVVHEKAGKVSIEMTLKQIGSGSQVMVEHKLKYTAPTAKGSMMEDESTGTPMYVGSNGDMTLMPEQQQDMFEKTDTERGNVSRLKSA